jgi:hypothetical protein
MFKEMESKVNKMAKDLSQEVAMMTKNLEEKD